MAWISDYQRWLSESESLQNAQLVVNHFKGTDWSKESLSAMMGNMAHESSLNPNMSEYGYSWEADRGYGLVQWTPRSKYWNWATANNLDPYSGDSQLARIDYEVNNNIQYIANGHQLRYGNGTKYDFSFAEFRSNTPALSVNELTEAFMWNYEGPSYSAGSSSLSARQAFAQRCFNELDWTGTGGGSPPANDICFIFPTGTQNVTSPFNDPTRENHYGVDFADGNVYPIVASATGNVVQSYVSSSYGEVVIIHHTINGVEYESLYAHMQTGSRTVQVGDTVTQGQELGIMGSTGDSTGLHLHFELHTPVWTTGKENAIDPMTLLGKGGCGSNPPPTDGGETPDHINNQIIGLLLSDSLNGWKW